MCPITSELQNTSDAGEGLSAGKLNTVHMHDRCNALSSMHPTVLGQTETIWGHVLEKHLYRLSSVTANKVQLRQNKVNCTMQGGSRDHTPSFVSVRTGRVLSGKVTFKMLVNPFLSILFLSTCTLLLCLTVSHRGPLL